MSRAFVGIRVGCGCAVAACVIEPHLKYVEAEETLRDYLQRGLRVEIQEVEQIRFGPCDQCRPAQPYDFFPEVVRLLEAAGIQP